MSDSKDFDSPFVDLGETITLPLQLEGLTIQRAQPSSIKLLVSLESRDDLPKVGQVQKTEVKCYILGLAPGRWIAVKENGTLCLKNYIRANCYMTDIESEWAVLSMSGGRAREVIQCLCPVDMYSWEVKSNFCFQSTISLHPVLIVNIGAKEKFHVFMPRSYARSALERIYDTALII